jgi:hypothetical protein
MSHSKSNYDEAPRIRQVIFTLDKNKVYKFDVNNTTTIKGLKRMICAAANVSKSGLKIFSKGTEYTEFDDEDLSELFPDQSVVEFRIELDRFCADLDSSKIRVDNTAYCPQHRNKLLYLYCQECSKSICSLCSKEAHKTHNTVEKYDYLQSSRVLVDQIFKDFQGENFSRSDRKLDAEELKKKISMIYFPELHGILNQIEKNQLDLIDHFIKTSDISYTNIADNDKKIKQHYIEGLDKLKDELDFERNLLKDDEVFVIFDKKYQEINQEKLRIKDDGRKFEILEKKFNQIAEIIHTVHNEIFDFLDVKKKDEKYHSIKEGINQNAVSHVSKDDIFDKLLSEVNVNKSMRKSMRRSKSPAFRQSQAPGSVPGHLQQQTFSNNIFPVNPNASIAPKDIAKAQLSGKLDAIFSYNSGQDKEKNILVNDINKNPFTDHIPDFSDRDLNSILTKDMFASQESNPLKKSDKEKLQVQTTSKPIDYSKCIMRPETGTKDVYIYNDLTGEIETVTVEFSQLLNVKDFLPNCSWINRDGKLYISGGLTGKDTGSKCFLKYDPETKILKQMPDMLNGRYNHSMISHGDFIYAVSGSSNPTTEKFDFKENKWIKLSNLTLDERQNAILYVYKDQLFAFFGYRAGAYLDTVEKLKLATRGKWEIVPFKNPSKLNLKLIGCATVPLPGDNDKIYFFGGKGSSDIKHNAFTFDFANPSFYSTPIALEENSFFCESALFRLSDGSYGGFDMDKGIHFLKLDLGE